MKIVQELVEGKPFRFARSQNVVSACTLGWFFSERCLSYCTIWRTREKKGKERRREKAKAEGKVQH